MKNLKNTKNNFILNNKTDKPLKNYLILFAVICATIILTIYLCDCYRVYSEGQKEIPIIRGTIFEITSAEIDHYIKENPSGTIYVCTSSNQNCRNFEPDFIKLIKKKDLQDEIVYLNLSNIDQETFLTEFNQKYKYKYALTENYPAIITYEDSKITNILQEKDGKLSINTAKQFIELNKIGK